MKKIKFNWHPAFERETQKRPQDPLAIDPDRMLQENISAFEDELVTLLKVKSLCLLNSGTAAIHLALRVMNIGPGDIVICQDFSFAATAFPIAYVGAKPVFVDSEPETWNMDPALLETAIIDLEARGRKPAAIIIAHMYGMPARMKEILMISTIYDIPVIEDAAAALGSTYGFRPCGSLGAMAVISFNGNKIITTGVGGALAGKSRSLVDSARALAYQAGEEMPQACHAEIGYNYRMSNVAAAVGRSQLGSLDKFISKKRLIHDFYRNAFTDEACIGFIAEPEGHYSNRCSSTVLIDAKKSGGITNEDVIQSLKAAEIDATLFCRPMHQQPVFKGHPCFLSGLSDQLFAQGLCLPSGLNLTIRDLNRISAAVKKAIRQQK